ncbi:hypothetical protein CQ14_32435 [Bradyrhizobium lablabi]|uniref:Uncharacterized protein n=1 Tax=Bradyrhizobium lablabi TaxID=722472 RepID=A0A0R3MT41_9BRAD|nr:hypothetical protein CQ14_32435 [Bradyrhizobium lablabi]
MAPTVTGTNFNAPFNVSATFSNPGGTCTPGEYRQLVKGTFKVNGTTLDHVLCGQVKLQPNVLNEDGCPSGSCTAYGHRACPQDPIDQYLPQRGDGCDFMMYDAPGFSNISKGKTYSVDLSFEGRLINTAPGGTILISKTWTTTGSVVTMEPPAVASTTSLQAADKIVGVHLTHNSESGAPELHVVVTRPTGLPPLDAAAITLVMVDAAGHRAKPSRTADVHEIGNRARATASFVYTLGPGEITPASVEMTVHGGQVKMKVEKR